MRLFSGTCKYCLLSLERVRDITRRLHDHIYTARDRHTTIDIHIVHTQQTEDEDVCFGGRSGAAA